MTPHAPPIGEDDLQAYVDERLEEGRRAAVEAYLAANPEARARVEADRRHRDHLRAALKPVFDEPVPARLRIANIRAARADRRMGALRAMAAAVALLATGGVGGFLAHGLLAPAGAPATASAAPTITVARAAASAFRTYVVEVAHPVEVDGAHEAHLMGWLSKRLGRPLAAPDLAAFGYALKGGRLLPAGVVAAAQLMYEDRSGRRLTLYVQAADGAETAFRFQEEGEAATFAWIDRGFGFAVTAAEPRARLLPIAEAVYHSFEQAPAPAREG